MLRRWEDLPDFMRNEEVKPYYDALDKKRIQLVIKRVFDFVVAFILLIILAIPMVIIGVWIKIDSEGPVFYRQLRVTSYGKQFRIHKFRTMIENADKIGNSVTTSGDSRITKVGDKIRQYRLDEIPQLFDVLFGNMSFVGTRPEVVKYVNLYKREYYATLLMPAGITSNTSVKYKDENQLINKADNVDRVYIGEVLPQKMYYNLLDVKHFSLLNDLSVLIRTIFAVFGKD